MVKKGKQIRLDVNIRGEPPPKVTWKLVEKIVETKDNVEVINVDYNTKLNINDAQRKDSGLYKIIAENEHGKDEAQVEIIVLGEYMGLTVTAPELFNTLCLISTWK